MKNEPQTIPQRHRTASRILLALDVIGLLVLLYCTAIVAAKFRQIFNDLLEGQTLPALTQCVLALPKTVSIVALVAAIGGLIYKEFRINNNTRKMIINATVFAAIVILFMVFVVAMFAPLTVIITSLKK